MIANRGCEELLGRCLVQRAAQPLAERGGVAVGRECAPQLGQSGVSQRLRGPHDGRVAGAELFGERGGGEQRRFRAQLEQQLGDPPLGGCERVAARDPLA